MSLKIVFDASPVAAFTTTSENINMFNMISSVKTFSATVTVLYQGSPILAMHIPDGFLSLPVIGVTWILAIALLALALKRVELEYRDRAVPLMGVCAAFIFAAQMINFPIPGGTSGHLLGGTLAGVLLGPWAGALVMSVVFIVQGLLFQDGGITAMGANIFNMGLIGTFGGYYLFRGIRNLVGRHRLKGLVVGSAMASWISVMVAAACCAIELAVSGTVPLPVALAAMLGWHALIGLGEALITVSTATFIWRTRPDLLYRSEPQALTVPAVPNLHRTR
jgi:cobalt/nickel transport system permease protein